MNTNLRKVYPSQVTAYVGAIVPQIGTQTPQQSREMRFGYGAQSLTEFAALLDLAEAIPAELLPADGARYADFLKGVAAVRVVVDAWRTRGNVVSLDHAPQLGDLHPLGLIYRALAGLPDEAPAAGTRALDFLGDAELADSIRADIGASSAALRGGEWKAATVLAGAAIEALLLWELNEHPDPEVPKVRDGKIETWYLSDLFKATRELGCIRSETADMASTVNDFRNLIHPGRSYRIHQKCDLGSAHITVGVLDHVARDLEEKICRRHRIASMS